MALIEGFSQELQCLRAALNDARHSLASASFISGADNPGQSANGAIVAFETTLKECCALLIKHRKIGTNSRPSFLEHTRWVFA